MEKAPATVIFDFDGTLANSLDLVFKLYNEHATQFGYIPLKLEEMPRLRRLGYRKAMRAKNIKMRMLPKMVLTISREMRQRMDEVEPYLGIIDVLKSLQKEGFSIGILTSNQAGVVTEFLKVHNFPEFDFVVSEKTLFGKDKALKRILKRFGLDKNQVLYVGDEPRDVTACRKIGISVVGVSWGLAGKEGFENESPDVLVETPEQLYDTIIKMSQE